MPLKSRRNANAAPPKAPRKRSRGAVREEVIGRLTELDPKGERAEVTDERSNRRVWLDLSRTRLRDVTDSDGDGRRSITDLFPGDRVRVVASRSEGETPVARSLWRLGPEGPVGGLRRLVGR